MIKYISSWFDRLRHSIRGIKLWLAEGYPFALLIIGAVTTAIVCKATWLHYWIILTISTTLLVSEMLNTAIEKLCNIISPEYNSKVKAIKDICSGAVLVSGISLVAIISWLIIRTT